MTISFNGLHAHRPNPMRFLRGYINDHVYVPSSLPRDLTQGKERIEHAAAAIDFDTLQ